MKSVKTNTILKSPINNLFTVSNTYDTNQKDKKQEQNLGRQAAVIGELTTKYEC